MPESNQAAQILKMDLPVLMLSMQNYEVKQGMRREIIRFKAEEVAPSSAEVLENQGMAGRRNLPARIRSLVDSAFELFGQLAEPRGILQEWPVSEFETIYNGNGLSSPHGPIPLIVPKACGLALFAATLGDAPIAKSNELFAGGKGALGFMLDAINSLAAERLGRLMANRFMELLPAELSRNKQIKAQHYGPGHCGWHISGQAKLFELLRPEEIGITLTSSYVIRPIKSISGFLVAGEIHIHRFVPNFPFCKVCKERKCIQRMAILEDAK